MEEEKPRRFHAKVFEVVCKRGRVLLSGSANATTAALGGNLNVEACVVRVLRQPTVGWTFSASVPPDLRVAEEPEDEPDTSGVLRAILENERIIGQVLTPAMSGTVSVFQLTTEGPKDLGEAILGLDRTFSLDAPGLEVQSWSGGRLVLQVQSADNRRAEGFVSVAAFAEITRQAGKLAPRLLALLAGTETPADVAAIMSWFHEDPRRLAGTTPMGHGSVAKERQEVDERDRTIPVGQLGSGYAVPAATGSNSENRGSAGWRRFMEHVFAAFRERRGSLGRTNAGRVGDDDEDDEFTAEEDPDHVDPAVARSLEIFERLLKLMLSSKYASRDAVTAFDLSQYICERLQPDISVARAWLESLVNVIIRLGPPADRSEQIAAAIILLMATDDERSSARTARGRLLRIGFAVSGAAPSLEAVQGFQLSLVQTIGIDDLWCRIQVVRTFFEQIRAYQSALRNGQPTAGYADLPRAASEEWPVLEKAISSPGLHKRICVLDEWSDACPRCYIVLPAIEVSKLRTVGIATAKNCCHRIILYPGA